MLRLRKYSLFPKAPILSPILLAYDNQTITGRGIGHADLPHEKSNSAEMTSIAGRCDPFMDAAAAYWGAGSPLERLSCPLTTAAAQSNRAGRLLLSRTPINVENQEKLPSQSQDRQA